MSMIDRGAMQTYAPGLRCDLVGGIDLGREDILLTLYEIDGVPEASVGGPWGFDYRSHGTVVDVYTTTDIPDATDVTVHVGDIFTRTMLEVVFRFDQTAGTVTVLSIAQLEWTRP